ncbi:LysR family glycine cleavage system transcriptional activator [Pseudomonas sp. TE3786]
MKNIPPLTTLKCFEAAARLGSVTQAAHELHVTHSAVSQQLGSLEQNIGLALFVREARGLRLTEAGRLYALEVRAALLALSSATHQVQGRPDDAELVITTLASFALHWLIPRLGDFQQRYPHYRVRLHTSLELQNLQQGLADIGIRMGQGHWPELTQKKLFTDQLLVVAAPHFADGDLPRSPEQILAGPLLHSTDAPWKDWCQLAGLAGEHLPAPSLSANDSNIILGAALLGQGIALERRSLVAGALQRGELVQLSPLCLPYPYPYWLVWQPRESLSHKQLHFIEWMQEQTRAYLQPPPP